MEVKLKVSQIKAENLLTADLLYKKILKEALQAEASDPR